MIREYLSKMKGGAKSPPGVGITEVAWSLLGAVIGVGICGYLSANYFEPRELTLLIGSFGASAVLVYGAIKSPLAQPRNLLGGHVLAGIIGVACYKAFGATPWMAGAIAVSLAIAAMLLTKTLHPPAGATALIAVIGGDKIHNLGFLYAFVPAGLGALILLVVALLVNNLSKNRKYPEYWF
ncbi:MAG TPA: HPP family protein [Thermodesulfovibrionales bacterium]|nr:HPP family protein [Thermodesulfovibrionales bacterium]